MTFEQFLGLRMPDLVTFAVILCGNEETGGGLAGSAVRTAYAAREPIADPDAAFAQLRALVVRAYLSEGMQLGRGPATDLDAPVVDSSEADGDWDELAARFVTSSKLQRAVVALLYSEHLDIPRTAAVMGSTAKGIERYLRRALGNLNVAREDGSGSTAAGAYTEDDLRLLLELYGQDVDQEVAERAWTVAEYLPEAPAAGTEPAEAEPEGAEPQEAEPPEEQAAVEPGRAQRLARSPKAAARSADKAARSRERELLRRERAEREAERRAREAAKRIEPDVPPALPAGSAGPGPPDTEIADTSSGDRSTAPAAPAVAPDDPVIDRAEARRIDRDRKAAARAAKGAARRQEQRRDRQSAEERAEASRRARAAELAERAERIRADEAAEKQESGDAGPSSERPPGARDPVDGDPSVHQRAPVTASSQAGFTPSDQHRGVIVTDGLPETEIVAAPARRTRTRRLLMAGLLLALVLLTAGIVVVAGQKSASSTTGSAAAQDTSSHTSRLPSPVVSPLPGTKILARFSGTGSKTVDAGALAVGVGRQLALDVVCRGSGSLTVGPMVLGTCAVPVASDAKGMSTTALRVVAPPEMSWRLAFIDQPDSGTDGALANPPDPILSNPTSTAVVAAKRGSGVATITVSRDGGPASGPIRIALTCGGSGLTLASTVSAIDGRYARSCFSGWSYDFDLDDVPLPAAFTVRASADTTWNLVVVRL